MNRIHFGDPSDTRKSRLCLEVIGFVDDEVDDLCLIQTSVSCRVVTDGEDIAFSCCEDFSLGRLTVFRKTIEGIRESAVGIGSARLIGAYGNCDVVLDVGRVSATVVVNAFVPSFSAWLAGGFPDVISMSLDGCIGVTHANAVFQCHHTSLDHTLREIYAIEDSVKKRIGPLFDRNVNPPSLPDLPTTPPSSGTP